MELCGTYSAENDISKNVLKVCHSRNSVPLIILDNSNKTLSKVSTGAVILVESSSN